MAATAPRPVLIVHTPAHMDAAFAAAATAGCAVTVHSAEGAGAYLGAGVFAAMIEDAAHNHPDADVLAVLDCGADTGAALGALRLGVPAIRLQAEADVMDKIRDMASQAGARLDESETPRLDLLGEMDAPAAARAWVETAG